MCKGSGQDRCSYPEERQAQDPDPQRMGSRYPSLSLPNSQRMVGPGPSPLGPAGWRALRGLREARGSALGGSAWPHLAPGREGRGTVLH